MQPSALPTTYSDGSPWNAHDFTKMINNIPPGEMVHQSKAFDEERERFAEKVADMSEATLDTILSTAQALKAKLAEHRAEREKQIEEGKQKKDNERLV